MNETNQELLGLFASLDQTPKVREEYVRSPFGYPGAKYRSLDYILPHLPYRDRYGEAFGGSGKVLLARHASTFEVFNDRYAGVTCFYRVLRDPEKRDLLIRRVDEVVHSREEFVWCRDSWPTCTDEVERAARWYYTIRMSFGSQSRNFGRCLYEPMMQRAYHSSIKLFGPCSQRLRMVTIENLDWRQCLKDYDHPNMVWYLDPPYYKVTKGMFELEMRDHEHIEFLERVMHLQGFVAVSSYPNDLYDKYTWDRVEEWQIKTSTMAVAFNEENHLDGLHQVMHRKYAYERLYIREGAA